MPEIDGAWVAPRPAHHLAKEAPVSTVPEGSVIITPAEVYNEVRELTREVRDLVTADKAEQRERSKLETRVDGLDTRMTAIERKLWLLTGAAATAGGAIGSAVVPILGR